MIYKKINFPGFNFSFQKTRDKYIGIIRNIDRNRTKIRTYPEAFNLCYILSLDEEFNVLSNYLLDENKNLINRFVNYTEGLEDARFVDEKSFLCVSLDTNPNFHTEMIYVEFCDIEQKIHRVVRLYLEGQENRNQKNWLYLKKENNKLELLFSSYPIQIISVDLSSGKGNVLKSYPNPLLHLEDGEELHGGSSVFLKNENKYLFVIRKIKKHKFICNYWMLLDENYDFIALSESFLFEEKIEISYQMCMTLYVEDKLLYTSVSINDEFVNIYKFNLHDILSNLIYI
jgi:hypothetical protein